MSDQLTDIIRSFIGYWHMDDVTNKLPVELLGTPTSAQALNEIVMLPSATGVGVAFDSTKLSPMIGVEQFASSRIATVSSGPGAGFGGTPNLPINSKSPGDGSAKGSSPEVAQPANIANSGSVSYSQIYPTAADTSENIYITQVNTLVDNDYIVFVGMEDVQIDFEIDSVEVLANVVEEISEAIAGLVENPFQIVDPGSFSGQPFIPVVKYDPDAGADEDDVSYLVETGNYFQLNGETLSEGDEETSQALSQTDGDEQQAAEPEIDASNYVEIIEDRLEEYYVSTAIENGAAQESDPAEVIESASEQAGVATSEDSETDVGPAQNPVQSTDTGHNLAVNYASVVEVSDGHGSLIVEGDYHEVNTIVQVNILHDEDQVLVPEPVLSEETQTSSEDENISINSAAFETLNHPLQDANFYGPTPLGSSWNVETVHGDYHDVTTVYQQNILVDNDTVLQTVTQTNISVTTGDNLQENSVNAYSYSDGFDLVIVAGSYYEYNTIVQVNVILDDDFISVSSDETHGRDHDIEGSANGLFNQASITNIGGEERFEPFNEDVLDLYHAGQEGALEPGDNLGALLPGNGGVQINVLFIDGDFHDQTTITQINVILDMDFVLHETLPETFPETLNEDAEGIGAPVLEISTGQNTAVNIASITDVDSPSSFQHLGGEYYENSFLIQADIVVELNEESAINPDELGDQTVTLIVEGSTNARIVVETEVHEVSTDFDGDVLGGIIA